MALARTSSEAAIEAIDVLACTVPTATPEADGTFAWDRTTIVIVESHAAGVRGLGYTYADTATARVIDDHLKKAVVGKNALSVAECWIAMLYQTRNLGRPGVCSMAISAVDNSLWDLKARLLRVPLVQLLGKARDSIAAYGSGGFTSYSIDQLKKQLGDWVADGIRSVKMKIGTEPCQDLERVRAARNAIGSNADLYVDANGAYTRKEALQKAYRFAEFNVTWFEEPVSSDDLEGLRLLRDQGPPGMQIAAGEYGYDARYFRRMLDAGAVDVLQADATRCAGITEFMNANGLCEGYCTPLSAHTAPSLHAHVCCAAPRAVNVEYFYDHHRIEEMLFEGAIKAVNGQLRPDLSCPGLGLELKRADTSKFQVYASPVIQD